MGMRERERERKKEEGNEAKRRVVRVVIGGKQRKREKSERE